MDTTTKTEYQRRRVALMANWNFAAYTTGIEDARTFVDLLDDVIRDEDLSESRIVDALSNHWRYGVNQQSIAEAILNSMTAV